MKNNINVFENIKKFMNMYDEKPRYLTEDKVVDFIDKISNMNLQEKIEIICKYGMEGLK